MSADFRESRGPERARLKTAFGILWLFSSHQLQDRKENKEKDDDLLFLAFTGR
jgi:hypothetical protein